MNNMSLKKYHSRVLEKVLSPDLQTWRLMGVFDEQTNIFSLMTFYASTIPSCLSRTADLIY